MLCIKWSSDRIASAETVRTAQGPRQRIVAYIGKEPEVDEDQRVEWEQIGKLLDGWDDEGEEQLELFGTERFEAPL